MLNKIMYAQGVYLRFKDNIIIDNNYAHKDLHKQFSEVKSLLNNKEKPKWNYILLTMFYQRSRPFKNYLLTFFVREH